MAIVGIIVLAIMIAWLLWPRMAERTCEGYCEAAEGQLADQGFVPWKIKVPGFKERRVWVREGPSTWRTVLILPGYAHRAGHYAQLVADLWKDCRVIIVDLGGVGADRPKWMGWMTVARKQAEAVALIRVLRDRGNITGKLVIVAHSAAATFAPDVCAAFPETVGDVIALTPIPPQRFAIARHFTYWRWAMATVPSVIRALLWGTGAVPTRSSARHLFVAMTLSQEEFEQYYKTLCPDSGLAFVQYMFFYSGGLSYASARKAGWKGTVQVVGAGKDTIMHPEELREMAFDTQGTKLRMLDGEDHCFFLAPLSRLAKEVLSEISGS